MASVRAKVTLQLGELFRATVNVVGAVDDDDATPTGSIALKTICEGTGLPVLKDGKPVKRAGKPVLHTHAPTATKQDLYCPHCENRDKETFKKGTLSGTTFTIVDATALVAAREVPDDIKNKIVLHPHPAEDFVGTVMPGGKSYFLEPLRDQHELCGLFLAVVRDMSELVFVAKWASRSRPAMYRLAALGDALTIQQIAWPSSLRPAPAINASPLAANVALAKQIALAAVRPYDAAAYRDDVTERVAAVIASAEGVEGIVPDAPAGASPSAAMDLTALLQASLDQLAPAKVPAPRKRAAPRKKAGTVTPIRQAS